MTSSSRAPQRAARAALDATLIDAAARADLDAVRSALASGADANAVDDATGYTAVTCAIAGDRCGRFSVDRVEVLRTLIGSDTTSLYALNAPARGVTPLGLAAWLNLPDVIRVLLDESHGLVAVDGTDAVGVTPLMYSARDGAVETATLLLLRGSRPDLRDAHHRTAVQHALRHPQLLFMCESALRKQRAQEFLNGNRRRLFDIPPSFVAQAESWARSPLHSKPWHAPSEASLSKATASLIHAACTGDVLSLHQHLYNAQHHIPILVNRLDSRGWSPLHYCVCAENPSMEVLDALFLAGADTSLYTTTHHGTPLHCLARNAQDPVGEASVSHLHAFIRHLVLDLRAPLSAKDENGETCLHVAAERGQSVEVLLALISCDTRGVVRKMKNSRGLTAAEVARPELRFAFGADAEPRRCSSVASCRTVRPSTSSASSASSFASFAPAVPHIRPQPSAIFRPNAPLPHEENEASVLPHRILHSLTQVGHDFASADALELDGLSAILDETLRLGELKLKFDYPEAADARGGVNHGDSEKRANSSGSGSLINHELLSASRCIINTANRDMSSIEGCMDNADHYLSLASHMLLQTERRLKLVVSSRRANLETARLAKLRDHLDDPFMSEIASTVRSATRQPVPFPVTRARSGSDSDYSFSSSSASSSVISLSSTLIESEDDDTRILRRFITRKVEARTEGALDEIDKVMTWLRIVQDTLRSLRRRTHASMSTHDTHT
ncbi:hypothetical protein BN946_scf184804.g24 [Trametes cinnabarina]|uniref:Uncharacterized protein n=1 Tax=Pycnoporus cinnabarinus TaxID=5643 RepID=A0A060S8T4_PYCCI|nr:hypothetical protein BN946_scf184804.g24 [Trametes cinnabarina]